MLESSNVLRSYLRAIRRLSKATTASLFVPASSSLSKAMLIHEGELPPLPEMVDLETADELSRLRRARLPAGQEMEEPLFFQELRSKLDSGRLIRVAPIQSILALTSSSAPARRRTDQAGDGSYHAPIVWIGLRFEKKREDPPGSESRRLPLSKALDQSEGSEAWWSYLLALGGALGWHIQQVSSLLDDPVTGLPGRTELQASLGVALERSLARKSPLAVLLLNPEDFTRVNERFGKEAGDGVLREAARRLRSAVRTSDHVSKYGGAVFAAVLLDTPLTEARSVADKLVLVLTEGAYLGGALRLRFSVGFALFDPESPESMKPLDLIRRADQALNVAKRSGGGRVVAWRPESEIEESGNVDRLSGIFTADMTKDYRNMVLLWDVVTVVAGSTDLEDLGAQVVDRLFSSFKPNRVGLFRWSNGDSMRLVCARVRHVEDVGTGDLPRAESISLGEEERSLLEQARREGGVFQDIFPDDDRKGTEARRSCYAIPLRLGEECLGCLYLDGPEDELALDSSDLVFLNALAGQVAVALDRARLAEREKRRLQLELNELRQALKQSRLVHASAQMEALLDTVRRVAPTDATVLITGESGTGKELLARTIHELSSRRKQPFVIVDCSALATSLIDSELFGHERGAYTGAHQQALGRLADAQGGTVLLDEIAELPLEAQSKLLRFVQEKQLTPVGGTRARRVDVRILAATNRNLATEVAQGRFRGDLYHRLNVIRLGVLPLRERPDDILYLANHFLKTYSVSYQKPLRTLSREAEAALLAHEWPGNVRELQNRLMQTMILSEGDEVGPAELGFETAAPTRAIASRTPAPESQPNDHTAARPGRPSHGGTAVKRVGPDSCDGAVEELRAAIGLQIEEAMVQMPRAVPVGRWLGEDLILEAHAAGDGVLSRGAALVGIPETTFRRRLQQARARIELSPRPHSWDAARRAIASLVWAEDSSANGGRSREDLLIRVRRLLLEELSARLPNDVVLGAALAGVTVPTYRRWMAKYQRSA